jgi:hypothetical protein
VVDGVRVKAVVRVMDGVKLASGGGVARAVSVEATSLASAVAAALVEATTSATRVSMAAVGSWLGPESMAIPDGMLQAELDRRNNRTINEINLFPNIVSSPCLVNKQYHTTFTYQSFNPLNNKKAANRPPR